MSQLVIFILVFFAGLFAQSAMAVDESRIWLPKKYSAVKPKLLAAAREAEQTSRCITVVAGEMIVRKNTDEHYYFVITCRDKHYKSYNLTYLYPVVGQTPELVAEQLPKNTKKQQKIDVAETGIDKEQAAVLCRNELVVATDTLDEVTLLEDLLVGPSIVQAEGQLEGQVGVQKSHFLYVMPFTALSELGNDARYRADCRVSREGKATIEVVLESAGALVLCKDSLRAESILLGRSQVLDDSIVELPASDGGFHFQIPFDAKTSGSSAIRYLADCQLTADGSSEIVMNLQALGALAICKDSLRMETFLMKAVEIAENPLSESVTDDFFKFQLGFSANDPDGNQRQFVAHCLVDQEAEVEISTEIDKNSILAVCTRDLKIKVKRMLDVVILEQSIPPLQESKDENDEGGYLGIIPFDAKNPSGRLLRYQAECQVDGSGRSKIQIKTRGH